MDTLFFWISKLVWLVISPDTLLLLVLILCWLMLVFGAIRVARRLLGISLIIFTLISIFPFGEWMLYPLETRFQTNPPLPETVHGIINLGGSLDARATAQWDQVEMGGAAERNFAFIQLARKYPQAKLVFTGGSGSMVYQDYKEATVAERLFREQGLDTSRIVFESESRNTYENAVRSKELMEPKPGENWILITTAWHMPRSTGIFCQVNWPTIPYPVDHATLPESLFRADLSPAGHLGSLNTGIKEWIGLIVYFISGKTPSLLPSSCL